MEKNLSVQGWKYAGQYQPVGGRELVDIMLRDGTILSSVQAGGFSWKNRAIEAGPRDIIYWRLSPSN